MSFHLVVEKGRSKGKALRLKPNGKVVVGREASTQLTISDPQTSRRHFEIEGKLGEFVLRDLNSSNGTFVNGESTQSVTLAPGDKIAIGDTLVYFLKETQDADAKNRKGELTGREIAGYRIGRLLGRGGMGTVYEAVQISLERTVAFKTLAPELTNNPEFIERFISEARAAGRLSHANIVAVFDVGQQDDLYFYSMEYMAGGSIDDVLRSKGPMNFQNTIPIVFDAARGLEYAEKHGLIHRDIKPDNLMLGADDVVKICDLGLATFSSRQHEVSGSPHYIAPEQALGKDLDHRADLYALGVSWYEMLCGETPFTGSSPQQIARKHVEEEAPPLAERAPDTPPEVLSLVEKLMAKNPAERVASARQLQADLAELARRYPLRETVLLRIDAVAPDEPPSEAVLQAVDEEEAADSRGLAYAALALVAVVLLAGAFVATRFYMNSKQRRLAEVQARVAAVRTQLEQGDLAGAQRDGRALSEELSEAGFEEQAEAAAKLADEAEQRGVQADRDRLEKEARAKLEEATALYEKLGKGRASEPGAQERLEGVQGLLDGIIADYGSTGVAKQAQDLRSEVQVELEQARSAERRRAQHKANAVEALKSTKQGIETLLAEELRGGARFQTAVTRAREYIDRYGDVDPVGGPTLIEFIKSEATRAVRRQVAEANRHIIAARWSEATTVLQTVSGPIGFEELERKVRDAYATLKSRRTASQRDRDEEDARADRALLGRMKLAIAKDHRERRYASAARTYFGEALHLKTERANTVARIRAERLEGAARAVKLLVKHVRAGKPGIEMELEFKGAGVKKGQATMVGPRGRRFSFGYSHYLSSVNIDEFQPQQLLLFFDAMQLSPKQKLDLARLAFELGQDMWASQLLQQLRALDPSLKQAIDDLVVLAQEQ